MRYTADPLLKLGLRPDYTDTFSNLEGIVFQNINNSSGGDSYWVLDTPGIKYPGHISVGADAAVDATGPFNSALQGLLGVGTTKDVFSIYETMTGTPATYNNGLAIKTQANFSSAASVFGGLENTAITNASYTGNITIGYGMFNAFVHNGSGTISPGAYASPATINNKGTGTIASAYSVYGAVTNESTGTITNAYDLYAATITNTGGGTLTSARGLYLEAQSAGSTNYNMYSAGLGTRNYFQGYVETSNAGGFYLGTVGSVNNRFLLNAYLTADATAEQINTPSSTARKALVLQMNSSQTANAFEVQNNSGTLLVGFSPTGDIVSNTSNGTKIGTATSQKLAFYNSTPVVQQSGDVRAILTTLGLASSATVGERVNTVSDATSITPSIDSYDMTHQTNTQAAGTLTINAPSGTPRAGQEHTIRVKSTNVQTFSFNSTYRGSTDTPLPVSTYAGSTTIYMKFKYNSTDTKWDLLAISDGY